MAQTVELNTLGAVIKTAYEGQTNTNAYTDAEKEKLAGIAEEATKNQSDSALIDRSNHTGFQTASTISDLSDLMDTKVDKIDGQGLSESNFTQAEKDKLSGLEGPHFKGTYPSLQALMDAGIIAVAGDYADVDGGAGEETFRCIWDVSNSQWVEQLGTSTQLTGAQIKSEYEAQPDTNVFDDSEKYKLAGIADDATKNSTDATLLNRANHTGTQAISTVDGLSDALDQKVNVVSGRGLSQENYTDTEKSKLAGIDSGTRFTLNRVGTWNAATNTPSLANGTGTPGNYYEVSTAGNRTFGSINYTFAVNDIVIYQNGVWKRISSNPYNHRGNISPAIPALYAVRSTVNNSYPRATETVIENWSAQYNPFSILGSNGLITPPSWATHIRIQTNIAFSGSETAANRFGGYIYRNSTIISNDAKYIANFNGPNTSPCTAILPLSPGHNFSISLWHSFETNKELNSWTWLNVELFEAQ